MLVPETEENSQSEEEPEQAELIESQLGPVLEELNKNFSEETKEIIIEESKSGIQSSEDNISIVASDEGL